MAVVSWIKTLDKEKKGSPGNRIKAIVGMIKNKVIKNTCVNIDFLYVFINWLLFVNILNFD